MMPAGKRDVVRRPNRRCCDCGGGTGGNRYKCDLCRNCRRCRMRARECPCTAPKFVGAIAVGAALR